MPGAVSGAPFTEELPDLFERADTLSVVGGGQHRRDTVVGRRAVAIATDAMELLRPESDLARLLSGFDRVDVLLAAEAAPALDDRDDAVWDDATWDDATWDDAAWDDSTRHHRAGHAAIADVAPRDEVRDRAVALGHPDLVVHRLGLPAPLTAGAEDDLVAGMSELVGFDPEPGLCCLAPAASLGGFGTPDEPGRGAMDRAAQRIARVYGVPLLRYRCLELSLVPEQR